jgi:hypothetical protein
MSSVLGNGVLLAAALAAAQYTGNRMLSDTVDPEQDRFTDKTAIRRRFMRPVQETINEIGEGRGMSMIFLQAATAFLTLIPGIYGPGYDERRKARIKENYGIDVPEPFYKSS